MNKSKPTIRPALAEKLKTYSAMGAAFLAAAPAVDAAIIYHNPPDIVLQAGPFTGPPSGTRFDYFAYLDIDGNQVSPSFNSGADVRLWAGVNDFSYYERWGFGSVLGINGGGAATVYDTNGSNWWAQPQLQKLGSGDPIGPSLNFQNSNLIYSGSALLPSYGWNGAWGAWRPFPSTGYVGIKFLIGGNTHYGWIQLQQDHTQRQGKITVMDYAYEDVMNTPIVAGAGAALPVPTMSEWGLINLGLMLLTMGTLFIRRIREKLGLQVEEVKG